MKYSGSCQCGKIAFDVELTIDKVMSCNCSRCRRLGTLNAFAPKDKFTLKSGQDALREYQFNKHIIHHYFCTTCGIQPFSEAIDPRTRTPMVAINARCLEGVDPESFEVAKFDGSKL